MRVPQPSDGEADAAEGAAVTVDRSDRSERLGDGTGDDEARQKRLLSDRLAAVDTLAAGLSHEINNPLTYTLINVEHVLRRIRVFAGGPPSPEAFEEFHATLPALVDSLAQTLHGMQRVREVVRNLMTFSRGCVESSTLVDVRGVAESAIQMAMHEVMPRARLVRALGEVSPVMGSEAQLGQVFLSLIVNAAQSIPGGDPRQHEVRICTRMGDGKVIVEVSDTGAGIAPEVLPRIFDPFFTSRGAGQGTGMGLSVCYGTIQRLGGDITVASEPERGSTFRVVLPPASAWRQEPVVASRRHASPKRRVLVLDDDALIGEGIARALEDIAVVTVVADAPAVLDRLAKGERWDTILCDSSLADMSGIDVYRETLRLAPDAAACFVFMTAGAFTPHVRAFLDSVGNECLEKPFDVAKIRKLVSRTDRTRPA
jgi:signal transduction histidine kinase/CheY-like chemotaxis protein